MLSRFFNNSQENDNTLIKEFSQIQEALKFLNEFLENDFFKQSNEQIKLMFDGLKELIAKIQPSAINNKWCRNSLNDIFKAILADNQQAAENLEDLTNLFFSNGQITFTQKKEAAYVLLGTKPIELTKQSAETTQENLRKNEKLIFDKASIILNCENQEFSESVFLTLLEQMIAHLSLNTNGQTDEFNLSLLISYKNEKLASNLTTPEKIINFQEQILEFLDKCSKPNENQRVHDLKAIEKLDENLLRDFENYLYDWLKSFEDYPANDLGENRQIHDKQIEVFARAWQQLYAVCEEEACKVLLFILKALNNYSAVEKSIKNPIVNLDALAFFLLKISKIVQSELHNKKIIDLVTKTMGHQIYDLIAAHFELEQRLKMTPPGRENSIISSVIRSLVISSDFDKFIIRALEPLLNLINSKKLTVTQGLYLLLKSHHGVPINANLCNFDLKIMTTEPQVDEFKISGSTSKNNLFVLHQPIANQPPVAIYFVDRRGITPVVSELGFAPNENIQSLTNALFPSLTDHIYADEISLEESRTNQITGKTNFSLSDFPALIKIKGKNKFFLHANLGKGIEVIEFDLNNKELMAQLKNLNTNSNYLNADKIWISNQHHVSIFNEILAKSGEKLMKAYHYEGDLNSLVEEFSKSMNQLFTIQNYPPEIQRIIYDFSKHNKDEVLGYLLTRFVNPVIKFYGQDSPNLKFWCTEIIAYATQGLIASENKRSSYQKRLAVPLLDLIYNEEFRNEVTRSCALVTELDLKVLNFKIQFERPLLQIANDAGLVIQTKENELPLTINTLIRQFTQMTEELLQLLNEAQSAQKNIEECLNELENYEYDFLILCHCFKTKLESDPTVDDLISHMDNKTKEAVRNSFSSILISALSKLDSVDPLIASSHFEKFKNREEYSSFKKKEDEQLKIFLKKASKKIWDKKIHEPSEDSILAASKVADSHFSRLDKLMTDFANFKEALRASNKKTLPHIRTQKSSYFTPNQQRTQNQGGVFVTSTTSATSTTTSATTTFC